MKKIIFLLLLSMSAAGIAQSPGVVTNNKKIAANPLNGTWIPVKQEMGGQVIEPASFVNQKLEIKDSTYIVTAESVDKGVVKCKGDKMDIYGKDGVNAGKHFKAIFKCVNNQLTICYNLSGEVYPSAYDTKSKPMYFMGVWTKAK